MRKFIIVMISIFIITGCSQKDEGNKIISTTLNDVNIVYIKDTIRNNIIPVNIIAKKEIKDFKVKIESIRNIDLKVQIEKKDVDDIKPWFVWATEHDYDWTKDIDIINEKDINKQKKHMEYTQSFNDKYNTSTERNKLKDYYCYQVDIALMNGFTENYDENEITSITFLDGDQVLLKKEVNINLLEIDNHTDEITPNEGALLYASTDASYDTRYTRAFNFDINKNLELRKIGIFDKNMMVEYVDMKIKNNKGVKEYKKLNPNNIKLQLKKDDHLIIVPYFKSIKKRENSIFCRNYMLTLDYLINNQKLVKYIDSGVVISTTNYEELYYFNTDLNTDLDFNDYIHYMWKIQEDADFLNDNYTEGN